jgi:hypothetical protein
MPSCGRSHHAHSADVSVNDTNIDSMIAVAEVMPKLRNSADLAGHERHRHEDHDSDRVVAMTASPISEVP